MATELIRRLQDIIEVHNLLLAQDKVIVAVSAGPDSVALLSLLCQIEPGVSPVAVYVDHGLRPKEVKTEILLVKKLAEQLQLPYEIISVDVKKYKDKHRSSLEEAGRILRYEALEKCCQKHKAVAIAVAHTADDQTEQILLRLIRGTGLRGLSAMRIQNGHIIRPLLQEKKEDLIKYLNDSGIPYCNDSSNKKLTFLRNRVRLELLPFLENKFNPSIRTNLLQTSDILQKDEDLLDKLTKAEFSNCVRHTCNDKKHLPTLFLKIENFLQCHEAIRRRIIEKICWKLDIRPSFRQIEQLRELAEDGKNGSELHLTEGLRIYKNMGQLIFARPYGKKRVRGNPFNKTFQSLTLNKEGTYKVDVLQMVLVLRYLTKKPHKLEKDSLLLDGDKTTFPMILRPHAPGERFVPLGMKSRKKISRFLSDKKIPRHIRHLHPVLVTKNDIVAVAGLRVDERYATELNTKCFLQISWIPSAENNLYEDL